MAGVRCIVLVGLMGSGKSAVARRLAECDSRRVLDTDRMVEESAGMSIRDIFSAAGEEHFRLLESEALREALSTTDRVVIATGGGAVMGETNRSCLSSARESGAAWVVWLRTDPDVLARRVSHSTARPLLDADAPAVLRDLHAARSARYAELSDAIIDTSALSLREVASAVLSGIPGPSPKGPHR